MTTEQIKKTLITKGIPADRAHVKAEGTAIGKVAAIAGMLLIGVAAALAILVVAKGGEVTLVLVLGVGAIGAFGVFVFGVGMTLISRDAAPAIAKMGELLVKGAKTVTGKG